jgi:hypothetical protein
MPVRAGDKYQFIKRGRIMKNCFLPLLVSLLTGCINGSVLQADEFKFKTDNRTATPIVLEMSRASNTVKVAASHFADDVKLVTGSKPTLTEWSNKLKGEIVLVGELGKSKPIDDLVKRGLIDEKCLKGKWEAYHISIVKNPFPGITKALVIAGSDRRGTAYGVFEVSRRIGVSPWYWFADVTPEKNLAAKISLSKPLIDAPVVKYRGIFINDEDFCLRSWARKKMDTDIKDVGPKTYTRICELLLRLKGNYMWPAMHCHLERNKIEHFGKSFYTYPENMKVADRYGIVMGSSHHEPLLCNTLYDWPVHGKKMGFDGRWDYTKNSANIDAFLTHNVARSKDYENSYSLAMRGPGDWGMVGVNTLEGKARLLQKAIDSQRNILKKQFGESYTEKLQIFCPYKEVLDQYNTGLLSIPDDVTLLWPDDNQGYIRNLSTPEDQTRGGRAGVYYHLSFWGIGLNLWLCSTAPALINYEMQKALAYGSDRLWVFNVGDIKPAECELSFCMDLAWNPKQYPLGSEMNFIKKWASREFGAEYADTIVDIKENYYRITQFGRPEYAGKVHLPHAEEAQRLVDLERISAMADKLYATMPAHKKSAFYQLVLYPVKATMLHHKVNYHAEKSLDLAAKKDIEANDYALSAQNAYFAVEKLSHDYNYSINGDKWADFMDYNNIDDYHMPEFGWVPEKAATANVTIIDIRKPAQIVEPMIIHPSSSEKPFVPIIEGMRKEMCKSAEEGGQAAYHFKSDHDATVSLEFDVDCPTIKNDSWFIRVNDGRVNVINNVKNSGWCEIGTFIIKRGQNTLTISQREVGAKIKGIRLSSISEGPQIDITKPTSIDNDGAIQLKGGKLINTSAERCDHTNGGQVVYQFESTVNDCYWLQFFAKCPSNPYNSWHVTFNGHYVAFNARDGVNQWINVIPVMLKKGRNELIISQREPRAEIHGIRFRAPSKGQSIRERKDDAIVTLRASDLKIVNPTPNGPKLKVLADVGYQGKGVTLQPFTAPSVKGTDLSKVPYLSGTFITDAKSVELKATFLPAFPIHKGRGLRYAISIDGAEPKVINAEVKVISRAWAFAMRHGRLPSTSRHTLSGGKEHTIRIYLLDPALVINQLDFYTK